MIPPEPLRQATECDRLVTRSACDRVSTGARWRNCEGGQMIDISEIAATRPVVDGWRVSPGVDWFVKEKS